MTPAHILCILRLAAPAAPAGGSSREGIVDGRTACWLDAAPPGGARAARVELACYGRASERHCTAAVPVDTRRAGLGVEGLAKRAAAGGDPRVAWYAEHLARLQRRTPRGPSDLARARTANWLRKRGLPWKRIARACGYSERDNGANARKMAALYRGRLANGGTLPKARMAYRRRERGEPWERIARRVGYAGSRSAREMAKRYAKRAGEPWPVPVRDAPM